MALDSGLSPRGIDNVDATLEKINAAVEERAKKQNNNIDLSTSENWLIRDELIQICKDAVQNNLAAKDFCYQDGFSGHSSLLEALSTLFNEHFCPVTRVTPSHIATAPGGAASLDALLYNICEHGDGVLVPGPFWNGFDWLLNVRSGVTPVLVNVDDLKDTFTTALIPRLSQTLKESSRPIKGLLLTNPHNPFGQCYPETVIQECIRFCQEHNIHYISDEVYGLSGFSSTKCKNYIAFTSALAVNVKALGCDPWRVHVVWSISKDFGSSGLRLGACITQANRPLQVGLALAANNQVSSLTAICTTALLTSSALPSLLRTNAQRLAEAYEKIVAFFTRHDIDFFPVSHGPFVFARLAGRDVASWDKEAEAIQCFKQAGVVLSGGRAYHIVAHEKGWARITFAVAPQQLDEALKRLEQGLSNWLNSAESQKRQQSPEAESARKRMRYSRTKSSTVSRAFPQPAVGI